MTNRKHITNKRFSQNLCDVATNYGFVTIGSFLKALKKASPNTKWTFGTSYVRGTKLIKEIENFIENDLVD